MIIINNFTKKLIICALITLSTTLQSSDEDVFEAMSPNESYTTQTHGTGAKIKNYIDNHGNRTKSVILHQDGTKSILGYTDEEIAWHESGHAIATSHNNSLSRIELITIEGNEFSGGCTFSSQTYDTDKSIEELKNQIIILLSGGCAEQILRSEAMFADAVKVFHLFSEDRYCNDLQQALTTLAHLNRKISPKLTEIDAADLILELYQKAYTCMLENKRELEIIAHRLLQNKSIHGTDFYNITRADSPLKHNEIGPLPKKYEDDYRYRSQSPFGKSDADPSQTEENIDENGNRFITKRLLNGNLHSIIEIKPDNNIKIITRYQPDGKGLKLITIENYDEIESYTTYQDDGIRKIDMTIFHPDGSQTDIRYHNDGTTIKEYQTIDIDNNKKIIYYDTDGKTIIKTEETND